MTRFLTIPQWDEEHVQNEFTAYEDLEAIGVRIDQEFTVEPKNISLGCVLYRVAENGILFRIGENYDSSD